MVKKGEVELKTDIGKVGGLTCVGDVCFDADGSIRLKIKAGTCPPDAIKSITESVIKGRSIYVDLVADEQKEGEK